MKVLLLMAFLSCLSGVIIGVHIHLHDTDTPTPDKHSSNAQEVKEREELYRRR